MNALMSNGTAPAYGFALTPSSFPEAVRLAEMMSQGKLVPQHLQGKPADCLLVIEQAMRWGVSPFAVAQCTSVIQGRPMFEGKLVAAVVNSSGMLDGRLRHDFQGEGDALKVVVSGKLKGEAEPRTVEVTLKEAKTSNGMWTKQPQQQLIYAGSRVWARRHTPEVMLGIYSPEEMEPEQMRQPRDVPASVVDRAPQPPRPAQSGGLLEHVQQQRTQGLPLIDSQGTTRAVSPGKWLEKAGEVLGKLDSYERVEQWSTAMREHQPAVPADLWEQMMSAVVDRADALAAVESTGGADGE